MNLRRTQRILAPLTVCALLLGWIALSVANAQSGGFSVVVLVLANLIVYTDALDFALRLYMRRRHTAATEGPGGRVSNNISIHLATALAPGGRVVPAAPFAIIASVYNLEDALDDFIESFARY